MKKFLALGLALVMALSLAACGEKTAETPVQSQAEPAEPVVIKVSHTMSPVSDLNVQVEAAAERIKERTNGMVTLEVHPAGELITYADAVEAMMGGAALFYFNNFGEWVDYAPDAAIVQASMLFHSSEEYWKFMDTDMFAKCCAEMENIGIYCVQSGFCGGNRYMVAKEPINSLADAQKLSIRVPNTISWLEAYDAMGINGVGMSSSEALQALQTGKLDGVDQTIAQFYDGAYYEVCKYVNLIPTMIQADNFFCSKEFWDSLPAEYQTVIAEEFETAAKTFTENSAVIEKEDIDKCEELGVTFVELDYSEFAEKVEPVILNYKLGQEMLGTLADIRGE